MGVWNTKTLSGAKRTKHEQREEIWAAEDATCALLREIGVAADNEYLNESANALHRSQVRGDVVNGFNGLNGIGFPHKRPPGHSLRYAVASRRDRAVPEFTNTCPTGVGQCG